MLDVKLDVGTRVRGRCNAVRVLPERRGCGSRPPRRSRLGRRDGLVQRIGGRHRADQISMMAPSLSGRRSSRARTTRPCRSGSAGNESRTAAAGPSAAPCTAPESARGFSARAAAAPRTGSRRAASSSDLPTPSALTQSTPLVPDGPCISWFISPTPMIDPISVCELDDGNPKYQVARFHTIAAMSSANTIAKPAPLPTCRINSTGSSCGCRTRRRRSRSSRRGSSTGRTRSPRRSVSASAYRSRWPPRSRCRGNR